MTPPRRRRATLLAAAALSLSVAGLSACGDDLASSADVASTGPAAPAVEAASTARVRIPSTGETAVVRDVRLRAEGRYDRFVIELDGTAAELPGIDVQYVDPPFSEAGSGDPVDVAGEAFLQVTLDGASGFDPDAGADGEVAYLGPDRLPGRTVVQDAVRTGDFESTLTWVLGLEGRRPFAVTTEDSPARVVVDVVADPVVEDATD